MKISVADNEVRGENIILVKKRTNIFRHSI